MIRWPVLAILVGCTTTEEAARVELPVTTVADPFAPVTTDLGYVVTLSEVQVGVTAVQFTVDGEMHQAFELPPGTLAHPGHSGGGEITGELPGDHVLVWNGQAHAPLGDGTLLAGAYQGANFTFRGAAELGGHAMHLAGTVAKDSTTRSFDLRVDVEVDTSVIGAVFDATITEASTGAIAIAFYPDDPYEDDTAFDGVDFFSLPTTAAGAIEIRPGSTEHNLIRRAITTHDHYGATQR